MPNANGSPQPWELPPFPSFEPQALSEQESAAQAAHLRACSADRMIDYGMSRSDAVLSRQLVTQGARWKDTMTSLAERNRAIARRAGDRFGDTAVEFLLHEAGCLNFVQLVQLGDAPARVEVYQRMVAVFGEAQRIDNRLPAHVAIDSEVGTLAAWVVPPAEPGGAVVIQFGGLTGWGIAFHKCAMELVRKRIGSVILELPGQGLTRMEHKTYLDDRFSLAVTAVVDWIEANWQSTRVGIWGHSMGGVFAALAASADQRLVACCINGAAPDPTSIYERYPRLLTQAADMSAEPDREASSVKALWERFAFDLGQSLPGSLLVIHGGADQIVTREEHAAFLSAWERSEMVEWPAGEHCVFNFAQERNALVTDWFMSQLSS